MGVEPFGVGTRLRQLQVFREVLRTGSARKAAMTLGISQPAVSQQLKQLELNLGLTLFERSANRISPTRDAWELLRSVDDALGAFDRLEITIDEIRSQEGAAIAIAAPSVFGLVTLPNVVRKLRRNGSYGVKSISGSPKQVQEHILSGRADIGVSRLPLDTHLYDWCPLATARNVCIFPSDHRFLKFQEVCAQDLVGEAIIDIDPEFASHQMNLNALRFRGHEPDIVVEYDDTGHEAGFVAAGLGISITNDIVAREYAAFSLDMRPFTPSAVYHYVAIWRKNRTMSQALKVSVEALRSAFDYPRDGQGQSSRPGIDPHDLHERTGEPKVGIS